MKIINIDKKEYKIESNAFVLLEYRRIFDRGILEDIQKISDFVNLQVCTALEIAKENPKMSEEEINKMTGIKTRNKLDEFIECITKIAWIFIHECNKDIEDYETWLKSIKHFSVSDAWVTEVTELAVSSFH